MPANDRQNATFHGAKTLPMIAIFLAGAVGFGLWQRLSAEMKYATFVRQCPNLSALSSVAMRTAEGRIVIVGLMELPEQYLSTFCPEPNELATRLGFAPKNDRAEKISP